MEGMVEIYMENIRDLLDFSKDNIQIKESKEDGIVLNGVTEISLSNPAEAFQTLSKITYTSNSVSVLKAGRLILVDLAGSEKEEKTGAEGKFLEEANAINKSLSALENVINALTCGTSGQANHIQYGDSKLTQILQEALGGNSRTALLCCCSPSPSNASESLSTLRFGMRFMASLDTVPTFEPIFIQFPEQNYSLCDFTSHRHSGYHQGKIQ
uniref:kinesin-1-like protein PSS1 n=1 Tax=Fragaria vesca subsp. vesca TaxID=101020 RepID=UPI0005C9ECD2|nr:PREDICTED: kinesin-1-like protein PSS1 [Fragaria vesca subsp. vesca]